MDLGVEGFVLKEAPLEELVRAVLVAAGGGTYIDPTIARELAKPGAEPAAELTEREWEIIRLLARGLGNEEIGKALFISPATVRTHLRNGDGQARRVHPRAGRRDRLRRRPHSGRGRLALGRLTGPPRRPPDAVRPHLPIRRDRVRVPFSGDAATYIAGMGVGRIGDEGSSLPVVWRGSQSRVPRRTLAVSAPRRVLVGTTVGPYPRVPLFGADRLRAAYGLDAPAPPPLVDVLA